MKRLTKNHGSDQNEKFFKNVDFNHPQQPLQKSSFEIYSKPVWSNLSTTPAYAKSHPKEKRQGLPFTNPRK